MPAKGSGKKIDCGKHGFLSAVEAGKLAGVSDTVIRNRIKLGWRGADLCLAPHGKYRITREKPQFPTMLHALKLAREFDDFDTIPSVVEIKRQLCVSTATATRWRQTFMRAMKEKR